jgi:hypothetical protein
MTVEQLDDELQYQLTVSTYVETLVSLLAENTFLVVNGLKPTQSFTNIVRQS